MELSNELLHIANTDLKASRLLYDTELYPQAIFYFQQSVEKACKTLALLTNQATEKELRNKIGHETIKIYEKTIKNQTIRFKQIEEDLRKLPELKSIAFFKDFDVRKNLKEFEHSLSEIEEIRADKNDLINISSRDLRQILREIKLSNKDFDRGKQRLSKFKITERIWNKMEVELEELYNFLLKYDSAQYEEIKNYFDNEDMRLIMEKAIKDLLEPMCITLPISESLFYLSIITLPHSTIARYPLNDFTPSKIYTNKLPVIKMLPKFFEVQNSVLRELKMLSEYLES